jgi:RES domain-containing protein
MNLAACALLATELENRVWFRAVQPQHLATALAFAHTTRIPSRFSTATNANPTFPILYLAEGHQVALFEVGVFLGSPQPGGQYVPNPRQVWILLNI